MNTPLFDPVVERLNRTQRRQGTSLGDPNAAPHFILDTNVFLDIHSCHDVMEDFETRHALVGNAAIDDPKITYRLSRARDAALLAMFLHKNKTSTMALRHEAIEMLYERSPPSPGGTDFKGDFTRAFVQFVHPYCLRRWNSIVTTEHGTVRKDDADRAHVALARDRNVPLISNEGLRTDGTINESKLVRTAARAAGVSVLIPRQVFEGKINEEDEIEAFLARFRDRVPNYLKHRGIRTRWESCSGSSSACTA